MKTNLRRAKEWLGKHYVFHKDRAVRKNRAPVLPLEFNIPKSIRK